MRLRWGWVVFLIAGIGIAAYLLRDLVGEYIVAPVLLALRIERLLMEALPQVVFWSIFILVGIFLAIRSLPINKSIHRNVALAGDKPHSRAQQFGSWASTSKKSEYSKWIIARELSLLAYEVLMYQERLTPNETNIFLKSRNSSIPDKVREYIQAGLEAPSFRHYLELVDNYRLNFLETPFETRPEVIIEFLEKRMESGGSV